MLRTLVYEEISENWWSLAYRGQTLHVPVLFNETLEYLITDLGSLCRLFVGGGGHLQGIIKGQEKRQS